MSRIYSYVVVRDFGFAPNPFHGYCTLATCKPQIRKSAVPGDLVLGTGSVSQKRGGCLVYCMRVAETMTFEEYWADARFRSRRPLLAGSQKQQYGDNIYDRPVGGEWNQADSHHSRPGGLTNTENLLSDTSVNRVLVSTSFIYWGGSGPSIPKEFRDCDGSDIVHKGVGHRCNFSSKLVDEFGRWIEPQLVEGRIGRPRNWK